MVFIPDTQGYSDTGAEQFNAMMNWIAVNKATYNIQMVMGEGDIVQDTTVADQWARAVAAYNLVDAANIPHLVGLGGHDYDSDADVHRASTVFNTNFGQARYAGKAWWNGGFFEAGKAENAYCILSIDGVNYLFLMLEEGPRQSVVDWANALLTTHADKTAILCTHAYMYHDDTRIGAGDLYNPKLTWADAHDGDDLWNELVKLHDNIVLVQSGHDLTDDGSAYRMDLSDGRRPVHQALANYQTIAPVNNGFIRMVIFDPANRKINMYSFSTLRIEDRVTNKNHLTGLDY